jgi:hypothetical protein
MKVDPTVPERRFLQLGEGDRLLACSLLVEGDDDILLAVSMGAQPSVELGLAGHEGRL